MPNKQRGELESKSGASALQEGGGVKGEHPSLGHARGTWNKKKLILLGISVMSELLLGPKQWMGG